MGLFKRNKNNNRPVIRQIIDLIPSDILQGCINETQSDKGTFRYRTYDQLVAQIFGQLNKCYTLEDISAGIAVNKTFIADLGLSQSPARSTMGDGNRKRSFEVYKKLYFKLLSHYGKVIKARGRANVIEEVKNKTIKIVDSTTISLCLGLFDWAKFRTAKGGLKIHTQWDDCLGLPDLVNITEAKIHDVKGHPQRIYPKGTIIIEDRGYFDFGLMCARCRADNHFVTRIKDNTLYSVLKKRELPKEKDGHILADEEIMLTGQQAGQSGMGDYALRRVAVYDAARDRTIVVLTNNFDWSAATVAALYKKRWDIELFFKSMKQNLQIKTFLGTSENAVKSQIYIAPICYLLLELLRRNTCKAEHAFSNFVERIRICLAYYLSLEYVCNHVGQGAKSIKTDQPPPDLFSHEISLF